jgi:flagellar hook-associated protein 2
MAGTISFGGVGSGIDTESIVQGLVGVEEANLSTLKSRAAANRSAASSISDVGSALSTLKTALEALDDVNEARAYTATSSNSDVIAVSSDGSARPGAFEIAVTQVAAAQRTYSNPFGSATSALGLSGTLTLDLNGETADIAIGSTDSLDTIVRNINESGLNLTASTFYDGSQYRLQIRGLETGADNAIDFTQTGFDMGLNVDTNTVQEAQDTEATIDGFDVTSATNQITGAIGGVTIAVLGETTQAETIEIASNPDELAEKAQAFIDAYNEVVKKVHQFAGFGKIEGSNPVLAGDSTLRRITDGLSSTLLTARGSGAYQTLASIGIELNNDGTLKLDQTKLETALNDDIDAVNFVLAGDDNTNGGAMDALRDLVEGMTETGGLIDAKEEALNDRAESLEDTVEREELRIDRYAESLRKRFTAMDSQVATYNMQLEYLLNALSGSGT